LTILFAQGTGSDSSSLDKDKPLATSPGRYSDC
jgi:hypothetical protein